MLTEATPTPTKKDRETERERERDRERETRKERFNEADMPGRDPADHRGPPLLSLSSSCSCSLLRSTRSF